MNKLFFLTLILLLNIAITKGQKSVSAEFKSDNNVDSCELTTTHIERFVKSAVNNKERIFVISKLGKNEAWKLNKIRLDYARKTLKTLGGEITDTKNIITAIGERNLKGIGSLEFYLGSQFFMVVFSKKDKQICLKENPEYLGLLYLKS